MNGARGTRPSAPPPPSKSVQSIRSRDFRFGLRCGRIGLRYDPVRDRAGFCAFGGGGFVKWVGLRIRLNSGGPPLILSPLHGVPGSILVPGDCGKGREPGSWREDTRR
jgi:hypothetical protein